MKVKEVLGFIQGLKLRFSKNTNSTKDIQKITDIEAVKRSVVI